MAKCIFDLTFRFLALNEMPTFNCQDLGCAVAGRLAAVLLLGACPGHLAEDGLSDYHFKLAFE
jgi:hypothetical protein